MQKGKTTAKDILQQFHNQEIMILGDVMVDRYLTGTVSRISPEAPVPVVLHQATEDRLGGAANVALNVLALGGVPVLCTVVGQDEAGKSLEQDILPAYGIDGSGIVYSTERCTTIKTRVLGNHQQMLRIDREDLHDLSEKETDLLLERIVTLFDRRKIRVLILQDYNKGVLTPTVIRAAIAEAGKRGILTVVDPKKHNFFAYVNVDLFKPNLKEIRDSVPFSVDTTLESLQKASAYLRSKLQNRYTMITLSEKGLYLEDERGQGRIYPTEPRNIADVSGAGDTVISIAALGLGSALDLAHIAILSNLAGGQVCEFPGVVPVQPTLLVTEFDALFQ